MKAAIVGLALCFIGGYAVGAAADPIHYNEAVSGDLGSLSPFTLLPLDIGANTVSGTQHFTFEPISNPSDVDFDSFAVMVPSGAALASITYATTLTSGTPGQLIYWLTSGNGMFSQLANQTVDVGNASPISMFTTTLPLGAGTYSLFNFGMSSGRGPASWADTYTWTLTVTPTAAPTPEPASLLLLSTGIVGVVVRRRRRSSTGAQ